MNRTTRLLTISFLVLTALNSVRANSPSRISSVKIDTFAIVGAPVVGTSFQLKLDFHAFVNGTAVITLSFPKYLAPVDQGAGETMRSETSSRGTERVPKRINACSSISFLVH